MAIFDLTFSRVKDDSGKLTTEDYTAAVTEALNRYSEARPFVLTNDLSPSAAGHDIALPMDWIPGFSQIQSIEFPIGNVPETLLDKSDSRLYASPTGTVIRLVHNMEIADAVRVSFSVLHSEDSVPTSDLESVANLAASICLLQLAATYGNSNDSTIQADSINRGSKTDEYRRLAKEFETRYKLAMGLKDDDTTAPAMAVAPPPNGRNRLPRWLR